MFPEKFSFRFVAYPGVFKVSGEQGVFFLGRQPGHEFHFAFQSVRVALGIRRIHPKGVVKSGDIGDDLSLGEGIPCRIGGFRGGYIALKNSNVLVLQGGDVIHLRERGLIRKSDTHPFFDSLTG